MVSTRKRRKNNFKFTVTKRTYIFPASGVIDKFTNVQQVHTIYWSFALNQLNN